MPSWFRWYPIPALALGGLAVLVGDIAGWVLWLLAVTIALVGMIEPY